MTTLCIIPARGGSKRIHKKNIKEFFGKPIIYYSIKNAKDSKCFDEIMVSTDNIEIKNISEKYGANVPFMRSEQNSNDKASTRDVILEVLKYYRGKKQFFDYVCCIYPTAPLINIKYLMLGFEKIKKYDYVFTAAAYSSPIQRSLIKQNNSLIYKYPEHMYSISQSLDEHYYDCGQFYWMKTKNILETNKIYSKNNYPIILSETECQDIDKETDWELAEMKYDFINNKTKS